MNKFGYLILSILFLIDIFEIVLKYLNLTHIEKLKKVAPSNILEIFSKEKLDKALNYQCEKERLDILSKLFIIPIFYSLFLFNILQNFSIIINSSFNNEFLRAIIFFTSFLIFNFLISLPFNLYDIFIIEKKYGFNKMKVGLFIKDTILSGIISIILISIILYALISFIKYSGNIWWLLGAIFTSIFSLFITYLYPTLIAPLFNKFQPIDNNELKESILKLSNKADFPIDKIFKMDASKRSKHSNAYFTGFGKKKRIVLFDTLLEKHNIDEISGILAHEIGHYKLKHIKKMFMVSIIFIFFSFFIAGLILNKQFIYTAFGFEKTIYIGLFVCMILFSPINFIIQPFISALSRKHEFQADKFASRLINKNTLINTLIKLYRDNLSNPLPHKLYKIFYYSHPTLLERIEELKK